MFYHEMRVYPVETAYAFIDYHLEDLPKSWVFSDEHYEDWRDWHDALDEMYQDIFDAAVRHGCVGVWNRDACFWCYVHRDTDGMMRVTNWDELGPVSHWYVIDGHTLANEVGWNDVTVYWMAA